MIEGEQPLTEVSKWDLEDVDTYNAIVEARNDHKVAYDEFIASKGDEK